MRGPEPIESRPRGGLSAVEGDGNGDVYRHKGPCDDVPKNSGPGDIRTVRPAPTTFTGPLGSTVHILRADADTIAALAPIDWNRRFRRVCLDPAGGLVTLMSPSRLHEELTTVFGDIVDVAAEILSGAGRGIGSTRLRGSGDPPDTGMEPDCAFYVGERARAYSRALREGEAAADTFLEHTPPDLVVEVEITHADRSKAERYADLGVREMWQLHGQKGSREFEIEFLALHPDEPPRPLGASAVLEGLEPADVREAMDEARLGATKSERIEAVARIVRRRRQRIARIREETAPYPVEPDRPTTAASPHGSARNSGGIEPTAIACSISRPA